MLFEILFIFGHTSKMVEISVEHFLRCYLFDVIRTSISNNNDSQHKKCAIFQSIAFSIFHCLALCHSIAVWFNKKYISLSFNGYYCLNKNMFVCVTINAWSRSEIEVQMQYPKQLTSIMFSSNIKMPNTILFSNI